MFISFCFCSTSDCSDTDDDTFYCMKVEKDITVKTKPHFEGNMLQGLVATPAPAQGDGGSDTDSGDESYAVKVAKTMNPASGRSALLEDETSDEDDDEDSAVGDEDTGGGRGKLFGQNGPKFFLLEKTQTQTLFINGIKQQVKTVQFDDKPQTQYFVLDISQSQSLGFVKEHILGEEMWHYQAMVGMKTKTREIATPILLSAQGKEDVIAVTLLVTPCLKVHALLYAKSQGLFIQKFEKRTDIVDLDCYSHNVDAKLDYSTLLRWGQEFLHDHGPDGPVLLTKGLPWKYDPARNQNRKTRFPQPTMSTTNELADKAQGANLMNLLYYCTAALLL